MKKLFFIIGFLLMTLAVKAQAPGIFVYVIVRDSIILKDSVVTHVMPDTLPNTSWVRNLIQAVDSVLWADYAGLAEKADSLTSDSLFLNYLLSQKINTDTINVVLLIPDTIKNEYITIKSDIANVITSGTNTNYAQFYSIKYGNVYQANVQVTDGTADVSAGAGINTGVPAYTITCDDGSNQSAMSMAKDYILLGCGSSAELQIREDTLAMYGFIYMEDTKGDSSTMIRFDTSGLRYNAGYYYDDIANPMWIPPRQYVDRIKPHAWMIFADSFVVVDLTLDVWATITNDYDSIFRPLDLYGGIEDIGDSLMVSVSGYYEIHYSISFSPADDLNYQYRIMTTDDGEIAKGGLTTPGDEVLNCFALWNADAGSKIWIEIRNIDNSLDIYLMHGNILLKYLY